MSVRIESVYQGQLACESTHTPSGSTLTTDAPLDNGGQGRTFSPTDLVATALGNCVMTILGLIAQRHDLDLTGMTVAVEKEMVATPKRRIGSLRTVVQMPSGLDLDQDMKQRLETAARHCPVHQSLHESVEAPIDFRYD